MTPEELQAIMDADASYKPSGMGTSKGPPSPGELQAMMDADTSYKPSGGGSAAETAQGVLTSTTQGLTAGLGDEITAGMDAGYNYIGDLFHGRNKDISMGQQYDAALAARREPQKQFEEQHPIASTVAELGGSVVPALATGNPSTMLGKIGLGGGLGAAYGFGKSEGGAEQRAKGAALGGAFGAGTAGILGALGRAKNPFSRGAANMKEGVVGLKQSDFLKSAKQGFLSEIDGNPETALKTAVREMTDEGAFDGMFKGAGNFIKKNEATRDVIEQKINTILSKADDVRAQKGVKVEPQWIEISKQIKSLPPADRAAAIEEANKMLTARRPLVDGSLLGLQQEKIALNKKLAKKYEAGNALQDIEIAMNRDIKRTIEEATAVFVPEAKGAIKEGNRKWGQYLNMNKILRRSLAEEEASHPFKSMLGMMRTSGGGGVGAITGALLGGPAGAAIGGGIGAAATTKTGKFLGARGLEAGARTLGALGRVAPAAGGLMGGRFGAQQETQQQGDPMDSGEPVNPVTARPKNTEIHSMVDKIAGSPELANIAKAVMKVESNGDPRAQSGAGAQGLMQIMPAMQKSLGVKDPFDPEDNIKGGIALLKEEIKRFGGNLELALAAYNAGSPKVKAAIAKAGSMDWDEVSRFLPEETRKYVPKVKQYIEV